MSQVEGRLGVSSYTKEIFNKSSAPPGRMLFFRTYRTLVFGVIYGFPLAMVYLSKTMLPTTPFLYYIPAIPSKEAQDRFNSKFE